MERYEVVIRFFREIGASREAEMYLKLFHKGEPNRFAVIEVTDDLSPFSLNVLALHLSFLSSLDLYPVVIHGPGKALWERDDDDARPREPDHPARNVQSDMWRWLGKPECPAPWDTGISGPTGDRKSWQVVRDATLAMNETLTSAINIQDGNAVGMISAVFHGSDPSNLKVRLEPVNRAIKNDGIPIVAALAMCQPAMCRPMPETSAVHVARPANSLMPVLLSTAVRALVVRLKPRKIIRVSEAGGIKNIDGSIIDYINLELDKERLQAAGTLPEESVREIERFHELLEELPQRSVIEICGASTLLRELFTQKGGGTLLKRGRELKVHDNFSGLSLRRIRKLIERSFGKSLTRDYFRAPRSARGHGAGQARLGHSGRRAGEIKTVIIDPDYKGIAIVREHDGLSYLDKFAVRPEARGEGIAVDLWTILLSRHPRIFWRSRPNNPINPWYFEQAGGVVKFDDWHVWWKGLGSRDVQKAIKLARQLPPTLF